MEVKVASWEEAKKLAEKAAEERLGGKIVEEWVDTIRLEPKWEGDSWIVRLRVVLQRGPLSKKGYLVSMKIDSYTGEVREFEARPAR